MTFHVLWAARDGDRPEIELFKALAVRGCRFDLIANTRSPWIRDLVAEGFPVTHVDLNRRVDAAAIRGIRRLLRERRPTLVHAFNNRALSNTLLAAFGLPMKFIAYCGTMGHLSPWDPSRWLTTLNPRVDRIVCVSDAVRDYLHHLGVSERRLVRIYKGQEPAWFQAAPRRALAQWDIPPEACVVGCAASMRPLKGTDVLLQAAARLAPLYPAMHLLLVGDVRDARLRGLAEVPALRGRVHFAGFRADAPALMGACDLFVMPTLRNEGLAKAVIEANCQAVPAVVTNVGGLPEEVADGVTGCVVPPANPEALADAMGKLLASPDLRRRLGAAAQARMRTRFSFSATVEQTWSLYESLSTERR